VFYNFISLSLNYVKCLSYLSIRYNTCRAYATNVFTRVSALFLSLLHTLCKICKIACNYDSHVDGTYRLPTRKVYHSAGKQNWYYLEVYLKSHNIISLERVKLALSSTHSITELKYAVNPRVHCEAARDVTKMLNLMRKRAPTEQGMIVSTAW